MVPNRAITVRICQAIRAGLPMDQACAEVGVDAPTFQRWMALGEEAFLICEERDPHCRFYKALVRTQHASKTADVSRLVDRTQPNKPPPALPTGYPGEPQRTRDDRSTEFPPLAWLVVEEAPIEIVIGSRPPWVYETAPTPESVPAPEPLGAAWADDSTSEPATSESVDERVEASPSAPRLVEVVAVLSILLVDLALLIVVILLLAAVIPMMLGGLTLIGSIRLVWGMVLRWRAGLMALRGRAITGIPIPGPTLPRASWTLLGQRHPRRMVDPDRTAGSVALAGRLRPQRE